MTAVENFSKALSENTSVLHKIAERSGFNNILFEGKATRDLYGKYLLHKYHIYDTMESIMARPGNNDLLSKFLFPGLKRKKALADDLNKILGKGWDKEDKLITVSSYIYRIRKIADENPGLLIAHAYVHYFADLSGGMIIRKVLKEQYNYADNELNAYDFHQIEKIDEFKKNYLNLMNELVEELKIEEEFIEEVKLAYIFSISALLELVP